MIQKNVIKVLTSIFLAIILVIGIGANITLASTAISENLILSEYRYLENSSSGEYEKKNSYVLNTGKDHHIYQILHIDGSSSEILGTNYYCLNATASDTWTSGVTSAAVTYDMEYDLVTETSAIAKLSSSVYSNVVDDDIYTQVMWIIDNMYTSDGTTVEELLSNAGIVYGTNSNWPSAGDMWYYDSSSLVWYWGYDGYSITYYNTAQEAVTVDIVLSEEEVEAVQQAAIWYFTNYVAEGDSDFYCYTEEGTGASNVGGVSAGSWFSYTEDAMDSVTDIDEDYTNNMLYSGTSSDVIESLNEEIEKRKQEQAAILYNYLVDGAIEAAQEGYNSSEEATLDLSYVNSSEKITESGSNYVIGPMIATITGNVSDINIVVTTGTNYGTTINSSNVTLIDENGSTITSITSGEEFSVVVPTSSVEDETVKVAITGTGTTTSKLLLVNSSASEQPIVKVEKETEDLSEALTATVEKELLFDLALRKQIISVNGSSTIYNESGYDATRKMNIEDTIPDTATYEHRKDPVVVSTGDIVTYKISIYNEGEIDGYASIIVDQLGTGLTIDADFLNAGTVTSENGNVYNISYDSTNNQITLTIDASQTVTNLVAYNGTIDSDSIEVSCEVTQKAETDGSTKHYLSNIAYIAEEYDKDGNKITQDRETESQPGVYPDETASDLNVTDEDDVYHGSTTSSIFDTGTNNDFYFAGEEDDDDFETVVVLPKSFDLALRKYITAVSTDGDFTSTTTTTTYNRVPTVDTSLLGTYDSGNNLITTAEYNHSKDPISLDIGDYVLYTIRVYNEGEVDGYAAEITDYLPEYLDFVDSTDSYISSINSKWTYDATTRKVTTTALANTLISAFDADSDNGEGSGLSYADVQIICKINDSAVEGTSITNIAEISKYADEDGERDTDIDSTADDLKYPDDESTYKDDEIENGDTYIPGQEDDDDFEKVIIRTLGSYDLVLIKEDDSGVQLNSEATFEVNGDPVTVTGQLTIANDVEINKSNVDTKDVYEIIETKAPDGYCEFEGTITITVTKELNSNNEYVVKSVDYVVTDVNGDEMDTTDAKVYLNSDGNIYVEVKDYEVIGQYDLVLIKEDDSGEQLNSEATFEVNGDPVTVTGQLTIANDVEINKSNVNITDVYEIIETKAPDGYCEFEGTITITVTKELNSNNEYVVKSVDYVVTDVNGNEMDTDDATVYLNSDGNIYVEVKDYELTEITIYKVWDDNNNHDKIRAEYGVTLTGKINVGESNEKTVYSDTQTLSATTTTYTWSDLYKYYDGTEIVYTVEETTVPVGYEESYSADGLTITNTHKIFDLALRKFITAVSIDGDFENETTTTTYNREPVVDTSLLGTYDSDNNLITTAEYNHSKEPVVLDIGDYVLYTIRVYNEGEADGYAAEITDYLPEYLDFVDSTDSYISSINSKWTYDATTRQVTTTALADTLISAFNSDDDDGEGSGLSYVDAQIICVVNDSAIKGTSITNIAEISKYKDEDGERDTDTDSTADDLKYPDDESTYKDDEIENGDTYIPGQEDDDDFEKVTIRTPGNYDLVLIKQDENGEQLDSTATFEVNGDEVTVTGQLTIANDVEINKSNVSEPDVYEIIETVAPDGYCEFEGTITITVTKELNSNNEYVVKSVDYVVTDSNGDEMDTDDATVYLNSDGNIYVEVKDYEIKDFDLALRKFITDISEEEVTTRIPQVSYEDGKITYTHSKDVVKVVVGDIVTYTIRVYNEGEVSGYAQEITDDIPEYLEYLPENETNVEYRWVMYDEDGNVTEDVDEAVKIVTDYASKEYGEELMAEDSTLTENPNLLNAFDSSASISDTNPDYVDVKVAFEVLDPDSNTYVITNLAQISEDADENGEPVDDIDSVPDEWNDGEDDQDYENVSVEYFDLSLLKYVTEVIVTEDGTTTTTKTGNTGADTDIIPKVEINKKKIDTTVVKFEFTIKITNEGDIAGYATEITDYVPDGLEFYEEDNEGWTDEGNNVISTTLLEDTLLEPGESATVTVILRWINGESNLGVKTNIAEISDDYNDEGVPDRDSTPDNQVEGEDDIDDASVLLSIKTGLVGNTIMYVCGAVVILVVLAGGVALIKRYVI